MGEVITIVLDIAKSVFQVHGVDVAGAVVGNGEPSEPNFYLAGRAERPEYSRHFRHL